jgi:hypothetical protein
LLSVKKDNAHRLFEVSFPVDQDLLERPVYTKDEDYVGVVEDMDNENGKLVVRGRNEMRTYSVPLSFIVNTDNGKVLLDMARDDFIEYEV